MEHRKIIKKVTHTLTGWKRFIFFLFLHITSLLNLMQHLKNIHETSQNPSDVKDETLFPKFIRKSKNRSRGGKISGKKKMVTGKPSLKSGLDVLCPGEGVFKGPAPAPLPKSWLSLKKEPTFLAHCGLRRPLLWLHYSSTSPSARSCFPHILRDILPKNISQ